MEERMAAMEERMEERMARTAAALAQMHGQMHGMADAIRNLRMHGHRDYRGWNWRHE